MMRTHPPAPPILRGEDIVCFSSIDWDHHWQGHQEIMTTLAAHGNRVLYIENTGVRAPRMRDLPRLRQRLRNWRRGTKGFRQEHDNLFVYSPLILPFPYSRLARRINRTLLLRALQRWMRATGAHRPVVWTFLPTPLIREVMRALDPKLTIYYCIDDFASSSRWARRIAASEAMLFREVDVVFVTSERLRQRAARFTSRVHLFPFAVSFERFERIRKNADHQPEDLRQLPRPIIGYVGGIHQWVDQELLAGLAATFPQASFVFVGPAQTDVSRLREFANVHLMSVRSHEEIPRYIKGFDVGLVPYRLSEYTSHVYPTKLNEYLAMGVPVVATDLQEIQRFNAEYGPMVSVGRDAEGFIKAVRAALQPSSSEVVRRRIEVARENSWEARIARMSEVIRQAVTDRAAAGESWDAALRRLYRSARRRLVRFALWGGLACVLLFQSPLVWILAEPLRVAAAPAPAEAIVVFAGGVGESGKAGGGYQERVKHAVDLYHQGWAPRLIVSSGYQFVFREAEVMKALAIAHGIPASAVILEAKAASTYENVRFVDDILQREGWDEILLVSSPYHMRRATLTWRKVAPEIEVIPVPVPRSQFYVHAWGASLEQIRGILHEYLGILHYWWKGWI